MQWHTKNVRKLNDSRFPYDNSMAYKAKAVVIAKCRYFFLVNVWLLYGTDGNMVVKLCFTGLIIWKNESFRNRENLKDKKQQTPFY